MFRRETKGQHVFRDSDLVAYICGFSDISDNARIARVCHGAFSGAVPFVWKHVEGVHNLLRLLPGLYIYGPLTDGSCCLDVSRELSDISPSADVRLAHYKLCIKSINIYTESASSYHSFNWTDVALHLHSRLPLPNLTSLDITNPQDIDSKYYTLWIKVFACSPLVEIRLIPCFNGMWASSALAPNEELQQAIEILVVKSPHIKKLPLFPESHAHRLDMNSSDLSIYANLHYGLLHSLPALCDLSCNLGILVSSLNILSVLSHLRSLTVWAGGPQYTSSNQGLSDTSFPALTSMSLYLIGYVDPAGVDILISMFEVLSRLDALRISIGVDGFLSRRLLVPNRLFPALKNLSNLRGIYVNFAPGHGEPYSMTHEQSQMVDPILLLPSLETVCLDKVNFPIAMPSALRHENTWRQVASLSMPFHRAWVHTLFDFTRLPNLQHLTLELDFSTDFAEETRSNDSNEDGDRHPVGIKLNTLEGSANSRLFGKQGAIDPLARRGTDELARRLLAIWPNLRRVVWPTVGIPATELEGIKLLNLQITEPWRINGSD
ncbi:hypothetical protein FRC12_011844 [Ceratobasidium sp. 428]|nr:hypothetical protein FRC12_011844 [Ceratobasidium sp. 428]